MLAGPAVRDDFCQTLHLGMTFRHTYDVPRFQIAMFYEAMASGRGGVCMTATGTAAARLGQPEPFGGRVCHT